jgi:5S rRNA maturation endonuclease (ribonuclease M5)
MSGMISYDEICEAFKHMELYDGRPANTEVLLLDKLDHKGMRIMKRFSNYLRE